MNWIIILGIISALAITLSIILLYLLYRMYKRTLLKPGFGGKATYFLDDCESEKNCSICLGRLGTGLVIECSCGKISHKDCALLTKMCPYCKKSFNNIKARPAEIAKCPSCKTVLNGSVCACGEVYRKRDGTIVCTCGNIIDASRQLCDKCGTFYGKDGKITVLSECINIKRES